ncbi:response regulator [Streptomyces zhihengii]|uniref:Response regulator n=1 Tax=Streptomyces zhihengii TaxID=1818004 RepID=A0ABS2URL1_9ACTN|nr:response regulator [Streptomyces zhihengii]MBM9619350.1 response regulator [Streptomyces zhihengii]
MLPRAPGVLPRPPEGSEVGKSRTPSGRATYSRVVSGVPRRVLVVDDNRVIRQLIRVNLELEGFEVVTAADGVECLDVVHRVQPDAITLDVVMPRLDGLRTAARLRADARTRHLPLAIISACTPYEVETGVAAGVDAFLAKPFEPAELVRVVRRLTQRDQREQREQREKRDPGERGEEPPSVEGGTPGGGRAAGLDPAPRPAHG